MDEMTRVGMTGKWACISCESGYYTLTPREFRQLTGSNYNPNTCVYCGDSATDREHVIPAAWVGVRTFASGYLVPSCRECNILASDKVFPSFNEKRDYIKHRIRQRYRKVLTMPGWSDEEIGELGYTLAHSVRSSLAVREHTRRRLAFGE